MTDQAQTDLWELTARTIGALMEVHRRLGPGLLESTYETCVAEELRHRRLAFTRQVPIRIAYRTAVVPCAYQADLIIEQRVLVELKAVEELAAVHVAQTLTYLKLLDLEVALLVNFNSVVLKHGIRRLTRPESDVVASTPRGGSSTLGGSSTPRGGSSTLGGRGGRDETDI